MITSVAELRKQVEAAARDFEPGVHGFDTIEAVVAEWAAIERIALAAKLRAAARAEDIGMDAQMAVAVSSGITSGQARAQTTLRNKLAGKPQTQAAFERGALSPVQAKAIADTVDVAPGAESSLLAMAAERSASDLLAECARVRRDALDADGTLAEQQHAVRDFRHWTDSLGMVCGNFRLEPIPGSKLIADMERRADRLFRKQVQAKGAVDTVDQRMADALVEILEYSDAGGPKRAKGPRTHVQILVTKEAVDRGFVEPGEKCETADGLPVPMKAVDAALMDPDTKIQEVVFNEADVASIRTYKRYRPARLQDGLHASGHICAVPGCGNPVREYDHRREMQNGGATTITNLDGLCRYHHDLKTRGLYALVTDVNGDRHWVATPRGPPLNQRVSR